MKAASIERSRRLQRVAAFLADGREHTTLDIVAGAHVCAVNSCIAELRQGGMHTSCVRRGDRWYYQLHQEEMAA